LQDQKKKREIRCI